MSETIVGTLDAVTEKGDWTTFEINVGSQYPVRLSTKVPELIELGRAAKGQPMEWTFNAVEGNINPKSGKPYINRYFEGVAPIDPSKPASSVATPAAGAKAASGYTPNTGNSASDGMTKEEWARKDSAIHRMAATKAAADALKHTVPADPTPEDLHRFIDRVKTVSYQWWKQADAVREGDDSDVPFLSEHDDQIPY